MKRTLIVRWVGNLSLGQVTGILLCSLGLALSSCSRLPSPSSPRARGPVQVGTASWYGEEFHGRPTASREIYDMNDMTAAHPNLPFGTRVMVTNLDNGRSAIVRINDRGPFVRGRIIDLSYAAARVLGLVGPGTARVRVEVLGEGTSEERKPIPRTTSQFFVQVGSFTVQENAFRMKKELESAYDGVKVIPFKTGEQTFYRVRISARDRTSAEALARRLTKQGYAPLIIEE